MGEDNLPEGKDISSLKELYEIIEFSKPQLRGIIKNGDKESVWYHQGLLDGLQEIQGRLKMEE